MYYISSYMEHVKPFIGVLIGFLFFYLENDVLLSLTEESEIERENAKRDKRFRTSGDRLNQSKRQRFCNCKAGHHIFLFMRFCSGVDQLICKLPNEILSSQLWVLDVSYLTTWVRSPKQHYPFVGKPTPLRKILI